MGWTDQADGRRGSPAAPARRTWGRAAGILGAAIIGLGVLRLADVDLLVPSPVFIALMIAGGLVGRTAYLVWSTEDGGWRLHARILSNVVPVAVLTYLTSWGSALVPLQLVAVAGNVKHGGYATLRPTLAWAGLTTLVMQLGVGLGAIPSALDPVTAHGIALIGVGAVAFVGMEFAHADRARQRAERSQEALEADVVNEREKHQWLEDEIAWQAQHDLITGLATRARLLEVIREHHEAGRGVSVLQIGIEGLGALSDVHGAGVANAVLRTVATRIRSACEPEGAQMARLGPDEFGVVVARRGRRVADDALANRLARTAAAAVRLPIDSADGALHLTANVGVASAPPGTAPETALLDTAVALHAARTRGIDRIEVYDPDAHVAVADRLALAADLRSGVVNQDFALEFQPIIDLTTNRIVSTEALVRWDHPTRGRLGPDRFIPEAERSGHIAQIGRFVIEEAAWQARTWRRELRVNAPTVAVNVSARQLDDHLVAVVEEVLDDTMLDPERLTLELTETALAPGGSDLLRRRLHALKDLGVTLALDDFGTGYSSLEYVEQLPLDVLKIDRTFVGRAMTGNGSVAGAIIDLARAMGLTTVIEGIETTEQRDLFGRLGCDRAQGYLFAHPMSAPALTHELVRSRITSA